MRFKRNRRARRQDQQARQKVTNGGTTPTFTEAFSKPCSANFKTILLNGRSSSPRQQWCLHQQPNKDLGMLLYLMFGSHSRPLSSLDH